MKIKLFFLFTIIFYLAIPSFANEKNKIFRIGIVSDSQMYGDKNDWGAHN